MSVKIIYDKDTVNLILEVYGMESVVCDAMLRGEMISGLVKQSIRKKGKAFRIKDQKRILELCRKQELEMLWTSQCCEG